MTVTLNNSITRSAGDLRYLKLDCTNDPLTNPLDLPEAYNSLGDLKLQPDVTGDVVLFGDTDIVGDGKKLTIFRKSGAGVGDISLDIYCAADEDFQIHSDWDLDITADSLMYITADSTSIDATVGFFRLSPSAVANIDCFSVSDVGNADDGKSLYIHRKAAEGDNVMQFYIDADRLTNVVFDSTTKIHTTQDALLLYADAGSVEIQPYASADTQLFSITDVGDDADGKSLYIYRKAAEGDSYIRLYCDDNGDATMESSGGDLVFNASSDLVSFSGDSLSGIGTLTAGTITDGTVSINTGAITGIVSLDGAGTIDLEDNLDGTGFTITGDTLTDGTAVLTAGNLAIGDGGYVGSASAPNALSISALGDATFIGQVLCDNFTDGTIIISGGDISNAGTITATTFTDGTATLTGGNLTDMGNITGTDVDLSLGTGDVTTTGTGTFGDVVIPDMALSTPTYSSVNDWFNLFTSAGRLTGGTITQGAGETVNVAAGTGVIRTADDDISQVKFFDWDAQVSLSVPTNTVRYIGIDYNTGTEAITVVARDTQNWDLDTEFPLGSVINQAGDLYIINDPWWVGDGLTNVIERFQSMGTIRDDYIGGLMLGTSAANTTRKPTLTAGTVWSRMSEFAITEKDCSAGTPDTFYGFYRDGGTGWSRTAAKTDIDDFYDDNSGTLQPLDNNKYVNFWVFVEVDTTNSGQLMVIYPQNQYNSSSEAEAEVVPTLPSIWYKHGILVGRIIVKEGVTAPIKVSTSFNTVFGYALASNHSNLSNLSANDHPQYVLNDGEATDIINGTFDMTTTGDISVGAVTGTSVTDGTTTLTGGTMDSVLFTDKIKFTQVDGNEYIDSLADGYMDYGATTGHRFNSDIYLNGDNRRLYLGTDGASDSYLGWDNSELDIFSTGPINLECTSLEIGGTAGWSGTFTNGDGDTVTVTKGLITNVA